MNNLKPGDLFRDSNNKNVVITRNGFRLDIPIEELIERERKNLGTIMDNVEDEEE